MRARRWAAAMTGVLLLSLLAGCSLGGKTGQDPSGGDAEQSQMPQRQGNLNLLTGTYDLPDAAVGKRPAAIMVNNIKVALPQYGISQADMIYEVLAEGGITRLMAVFSDATQLPRTGPVRSARDYYLDLAAPHDAMFVHWGTSDIAAQEISDRGIDNIDGMIWSKYYETDQALAKQKGYEHSRFIKADGLGKIIEKKPVRTESKQKQTAFHFLEPEDTVVPAGQKADHLSVSFSAGYDATFDYDEQSKTYLVSEFGAPHMDAGAKKQLAFTNVVVIYAQTSVITGGNGKITVSLKGGDGVYAAMGGAENIKWAKGDYAQPIVLTGADGKQLSMNTGKTYVCVVPADRQTKTVVEGEEDSSAAQA